VRYGERTVDRAGITLFMSHSGVDKPLVRAIATQLRVLGYRIWIDEEEIVPGDRILTRVEQALMTSDFLVLFLTPAAISSVWVDEEWRTKFEQQMAEQRVRVIPVVLGDWQPPSPLLQARLQIRGSAKELLERGAQDIDHGILALIRRQDDHRERPETARLGDPGTVVRMRRELANAVQGAPGVRWDLVIDRLLAARAVAAGVYDAGDSDHAVNIYEALLDESSKQSPVWLGVPGLEDVSKRTLASVRKYLAAATESEDASGVPPAPLSDRAWSARMIFDAVINYAQAVAILQDFMRWMTQLPGQGDFPLSAVFEPLRYAVHERDDQIEPLEPETLERVCATAITHTREMLGARVRRAAGKPVDLQLAATLRMCRCPSATSGGDASTGIADSRTAVDVVTDVVYLDMMGFRTMGFLHLGNLEWDEFERLRDIGAFAVFDRALSNRGYPRDAEYWTSETGWSDDALPPVC